MRRTIPINGIAAIHAGDVKGGGQVETTIVSPNKTLSVTKRENNVIGCDVKQDLVNSIHQSYLDIEEIKAILAHNKTRVAMSNIEDCFRYQGDLTGMNKITLTATELPETMNERQFLCHFTGIITTSLRGREGDQNHEFEGFRHVFEDLLKQMFPDISEESRAMAEVLSINATSGGKTENYIFTHFIDNFNVWISVVSPKDSVQPINFDITFLGRVIKT